jgi:outer membrane receptor protein involved in Fe transport
MRREEEQMRREVGKTLLGIWLTCWPAIVAAQTTTATVQGTIRDTSKAVLPGVSVVLRDQDTGLSRDGLTDETGKYVVTYVTPGTYVLTAELAGFKSITQSGLRFEIGQERSLDFVMELSSISEVVTVKAEAPLVETTKTTVDRVVSREQIDTLPLAGRQASTLAALAPGVVPRGSVADPVASGGQPRGSGEQLIDGVSNKSMAMNGIRSNAPPDAIQEFQVLTTQYAAEFGNASGVVLNTITRSGTNTFHGRAYYFHRDEAWDSRNPFSTSKTAFEQKQGGGWLGGPIVKNRAHYFASLEATRQTSVSTVTSPVEPGDVEIPYSNNQVLGKINAQLNANHQLAVRASLDRPHYENYGAGGIYLKEVGIDYLTEDQSYAVNLTSVLSMRTLNELRLQYARTDATYGTANPDAYTVYRPSSLSGKLPQMPQAYDQRRYQLVENLTHEWRSHRFKFGADISRVNMDGYIDQYVPGMYYFSTDKAYNAADRTTWPLYFITTVGDTDFDITLTTVSFFVQDAWRVGKNLTLNVGVRYDGSKMTYLDLQRRNVAPRIGFAWDPFGTKKTSIRGGFGTFYNSAMGNSALIAGFLSQQTQTMLYYPSYPDPTSGIAVSTPVNSYVKQDNQPLPRAYNVTIGAQRELRPGVSVSADYVNSKGRKSMRMVETNPVDPATLKRKDASIGYLRMIESSGYSDYQALLLGLTWRAGARVSAGASYTLSSSKTTNESEGTAYFQDDNNPDDAYGYSDFDQRHRLVMNASVLLPGRVQLGALFIARSAMPFNITTGKDNNGNSVTTDRPNLADGAKVGTSDMLKASSFTDPGTKAGNLPRNAGRGPDFCQLDLRVSRRIVVSKVTTEILAEAFNVLNRANLGTPIGTLTSSLFGKSTSTAGDPRQIQLGVRVEF